MKKLLVLSLFLAACGSDDITVYNQSNGTIKEKPDSAFAIAIDIGSNLQSVSCHIQKDCNNQIADLTDIQVDMGEIRMNFETKNKGSTSVIVVCDGTDMDGMESSTTHDYAIVIAD